MKCGLWCAPIAVPVPLGPLPPVWSVSEPAWQVCLAVVDGALVLGGGSYDGPARLDAIPLAPGGAPAWSHVGPSPHSMSS